MQDVCIDDDFALSQRHWGVLLQEERMNCFYMAAISWSSDKHSRGVRWCGSEVWLMTFYCPGQTENIQVGAAWDRCRELTGLSPTPSSTLFTSDVRKKTDVTTEKCMQRGGQILQANKNTPQTVRQQSDITLWSEHTYYLLKQNGNIRLTQHHTKNNNWFY